MKGYSRIFFILFVAAAAIFSCGRVGNHHHQLFYYNESTGIASLDPAFAKNQSVMWPIHQLYNTLVEVNDSLQVVPSLAKRWEVSPDRRVFTFYLRNDVFFHDSDVFPDGKGRKFTAQDVVYSLSRIMDKKLASPGAWIFNNRVAAQDPFVALSDTVFQLKLKQSFHPVLGILSMQYCSIVAREAVAKYGVDFRSHPVGTGPFQLLTWQEGEALIMKKNRHYFEKDSAGNALPYLNGIKISFFDSKATEFLLFRQHKLSFINDIDPSFKDEVLTKKGVLKKEWDGRIQLHTSPYLNTEYFGFLIDEKNPLLTGSPVRMKKIRQAINYGFDRRKMILYLRNSLGTPAEQGFVPIGLPSFSKEVKGYAYHPEKTRQLLQEAGFPNGEGLPVIKLYSIPVYADIASYIAKQLEESGIKIKVEIIQKAFLLELTSNSRALFFRGSWIADYPDGENYLSVFYSKNPAPPNYTRYNNPAFDALLEKALMETNDSLRHRLYRQADQLLMDDAPIVPLWYDKAIRLVQQNITGFYPNALNLLELRRVRLQ